MPELVPQDLEKLLGQKVQYKDRLGRTLLMPDESYYAVCDQKNQTTQHVSESICKQFLKFLLVAMTVTISIMGLLYILPFFPGGVEEKEAFEIFIAKYQKVYETSDLYNEAFQIFLDNWANLKTEREKQPEVEFDVHEWMDVPEGEMRMKFAVIHGDLPDISEGTSMKKFDGFEGKVNRPASHSWRDKATRVKNQGSCGSCWAFSTVASVELAHVIAGKPMTELSEQELVDCEGSSKGCHGGVRAYALAFVMKTGLVKEQEYPYMGTDGHQCVNNQTSARIKISDYRMLSKDESVMADWVYNKGPVTFGMKVISSMYSYRSGVFHPSDEDCSTKSEGNHAMLIVGYGTENGKDYWLVKNSWGPSWGDSGYFKLARGVNACGMAESAAAPIY